MAIPMVDLKAQYKRYQSELQGAIQSTIEDTAFILGKRVETFEKNFAAYCGAKHCIGVANGTDAIDMALEAVGVGQGHEVITTPYTFFATVEGIVARGAKIKFVDIDEATYCIDPNKIEAAITSKTRALLPVHLYGQLCDMPALLSTAKKHNLKVIEDSAQAHGATMGGKRSGTFGDAATFSFFPGKNLGAYGDAGGITTNSDALLEQLRLMRNHGQKVKYTYERFGRNSRLDALQAAILDVKLKHLDEWTAQRIAAVQVYNQALSDLAKRCGIQIICPTVPKEQSHVFHLYTIRCPRRDQLAEHLKNSGIECAIHYPRALHQQPALKQLEIPNGSFPVAEKITQEVISLPLCPDLTAQNQQRVIEAVTTFYQK